MKFVRYNKTDAVPKKNQKVKALLRKDLLLKQVKLLKNVQETHGMKNESKLQAKLIYLKVELFYNGAFVYNGKIFRWYLIWLNFFEFFAFWGYMLRFLSKVRVSGHLSLKFSFWQFFNFCSTFYCSWFSFSISIFHNRFSSSIFKCPFLKQSILQSKRSSTKCLVIVCTINN